MNDLERTIILTLENMSHAEIGDVLFGGLPALGRGLGNLVGTPARGISRDRAVPRQQINVNRAQLITHPAIAVHVFSCPARRNQPCRFKSL